MSITVPPSHNEQSRQVRPVCWTAYTADGTAYSSEETCWDALATRQEVDGVGVSMSHLPFMRLEATCRGQQSILLPPLPIPMFAFTRLARSLETGEERWQYTLFGYVLGAEGNGYRSLLTLTPYGTFSSLHLRSTPFML